MQPRVRVQLVGPGRDGEAGLCPAEPKRGKAWKPFEGFHIRRPHLGWSSLVLVLFAVAWGFGLVSFVLADGHFEATLPRRKTPPAQEHNLSSWDYGPTVRASSYFADWSGHHHPLFLVDGRSQPSLVEKWASGVADMHPWIELRWREKHDLSRVVLQHAGIAESPELTVRRYTITCLIPNGRAAPVEVRDNDTKVATHALACKGAQGIRVAFERSEKDDIVRVYEVETWGQ